MSQKGIEMSEIVERPFGWLKRKGKSAFSSAAQKALSIYLEKKYLGRYGELVDLKVDPENRVFSASVLLKGEADQINVSAKYTLQDGDDGLSITLGEINTSREWLTILAREFTPTTLEGIPSIAKILL